MPGWVTYENSMYSFTPTDPAKDLGTFIVRGALTDNVTAG
jgi:hypothetical protein